MRLWTSLFWRSRPSLALAASFLAAAVFCSSPLAAQSPNLDPRYNPEGDAGVLKPQVSTAGGYDVHSGNASRSVTDLHFAGVPGGSMDVVRYWNSIYSIYSAPFGQGGWTHSFSWEAHVDLEEQGGDGRVINDVMTMVITHPDGHQSRHQVIRQQTSFPWSTPWPAVWGASGNTHLRDMNPNATSFRLYRDDGSTVYFVGDGGYVGATWSVEKIVDAHGLTTYFFYLPDQLKIVGPVPAGATAPSSSGSGYRALKFYYGADGIDHVESCTFDGGPVIQRVNYGYSTVTSTVGSLTLTGRALTYVQYVGELAGHDYAYYTYQAVNTAYASKFVGLPTIGLNLLEVDDPRVNGVMTRERFVLRGGNGGVVECGNPTQPLHLDYHRPNPNAIYQELAGTTQVVMSTFNMPCHRLPDVGTRSESVAFSFGRSFKFGTRAGEEPGSVYHVTNNNQNNWWEPPEAGLGHNLAYQMGWSSDLLELGGAVISRYQKHSGMHPWRMFDALNRVVQVNRDFYTGRITRVWKRVTPESYVDYDYTNPGSSLAQDTTLVPNTYLNYLFKRTDELGHVTTYVRDGLRRVTTVQHPGGTSESVVYNDFNQITQHNLVSNAAGTPAVAKMTYNARGLLTNVWNSADGSESANETTFSYYTSAPGESGGYDGLVKEILEPRARAAGKSFSARLEYNSRHQVTKVTYPKADNSTAADPYVTYEYDRYGNCTKITDELNHTRTCTYDEYRRCTSYTESVNAPACNGAGTVASRTWYWSYDRFYYNAYLGWLGYGGDTHTHRAWRVHYAPSNRADGALKVWTRYFDPNERIVREENGWILQGGTWNGTVMEGGTWVNADVYNIYFTYDAQGNKTSYTDPMNRVTTYEYDSRDRQFRVNEPAGTAGGALRTTTTEFDRKSQKMKVTFPDGSSQRWDGYDAFGQPGMWWDERNTGVGALPSATMTYQWGPMKKLASVVTLRDLGGEAQTTSFEYDGLGREKKRIFPNGTFEQTDYAYGAVSQWRNREGQLKTLSYDARGRETQQVWNDGVTPAVARAWDAAGRLTGIWNEISTIGYTYDEAGRVTSESNLIAGSGVARVTNFCSYADGANWVTTYPSGTRVQRKYNGRSQLSEMGLADASLNWTVVLAQFGYRLDGKPHYTTYPNGLGSAWEYDLAGRVQGSNTYRGSGGDYAKRSYVRDERDRITVIARGTDSAANPLETGRGDVFGYDAEGQLTSAQYEALDPAGSPSASLRQDQFYYDQMGNRVSGNWLANLAASWTFTRRDNGLNQVNTWGAKATQYDANAAAGAGLGNGNLEADGDYSAGYNAHNQVRWMWVSSLGSTWQWFGYDPLGRCVKRWVATSPTFGGTYDPNLANATYLYYEGWNLIQEYSAATTLARSYYHGGRVDEIIAQQRHSDGATRYHHYDARTHCILLTKENGEIDEQYTYDAFGWAYVHNAAGAVQNSGTVAATSPFGNRFLFTGREWLSQLKVYDYRHRLYHPLLGRFAQPDPKHFGAGDYNLYRYCHNDPVNRVDPSGRNALTVARVIIMLPRLISVIRDAGATAGLVYFASQVGESESEEAEKVKPEAPTQAPPVPASGLGGTNAEEVDSAKPSDAKPEDKSESDKGLQLGERTKEGDAAEKEVGLEKKQAKLVAERPSIRQGEFEGMKSRPKQNSIQSGQKTKVRARYERNHGHE